MTDSSPAVSWVGHVVVVVKAESAARIVVENVVDLGCMPQVVVAGFAGFFFALVVVVDIHPPLMDADPNIELVVAEAPAH
jgi:hypothetical protein